MEPAKADTRPASARRLFELQPPPPEQMDLETSPRASIVESYIFTRASEHSWHVLNQHLATPQGAVFWISGPPGCGKTHFLNYVVALQKRAGSIEAQNLRRLVCGFQLAGRMRAAEVELFLLSMLADQIGGDQRASSDLFRLMRGASALNVGLETARRTGVGAITVAIDFGKSRCDDADEVFATLAHVSSKFKPVKFTVIAASRSTAPEATVALSVAATDAAEEKLVAVQRARHLLESAASNAESAYSGIDTGGLSPEAIFPLHPATLNVLAKLAAYPLADSENAGVATIASMARLVRDALFSAPVSDAPRLVYPSDLTANPAISNLLKMLLSDAGRAAWKIVRDRVADADGYERDLARELVDTLMIDAVCGGVAIPIEDLRSCLPILARSRLADSRAMPDVGDLVARLEASTGGVIRVEDAKARFDSEAAAAPEISAFNTALPLARRFDPGLTPVRDRDGLGQRISRLDAAMALAVERASSTREILVSALKEANLAMPPANGAAIAEYIALAEAGASAMLEAVADRQYLASATETISAYESLAAAAELVPKLRAMREYLSATGLRAAADETRVGESVGVRTAIVSLETECELLQVELGPRIFTSPPRNLDALEARFHKFKWTYVQCYLSAHQRWVEKIERLDVAIDDARRYFDALGRLNAIAALGAPVGSHLGARLASLRARVVRCDLGGRVAPELAPVCPSCHFQLGAVSPQAEIEAAMEEIRRSLEIKLAALSHSMIARLIRDHDVENRLEGFLKITQAAQTDALVRVLDDNLSRYLARVLEDVAE